MDSPTRRRPEEASLFGKILDEGKFAISKAMRNHLVNCKITTHFSLILQVPIPPDMLIDASVADTFGQYEGDKLMSMSI